jgi:cell division septation protein DedD
MAPAPQSVQAPSFGTMFADLGKPTTVVSPAAGSVDIRKIEPKRPPPKPKPKPEPKKQTPTQPSRIWVQLGIGQKVSALNHDWRRMQRANPDVFKGQKPYSARLNQTNRLLTGPFASQKEAGKFIDTLKKAGISGPYVWTSPTGEVVDELGK